VDQDQRTTNAFLNLTEVLIYRGKNKEALDLAVARADQEASRSGPDWAGRSPLENAVSSLQIIAESLAERNQHELRGQVMVAAAKYMQKEYEADKAKSARDAVGILEYVRLPFLENDLDKIGPKERAELEKQIKFFKQEVSNAKVK
jgi:hypothetical protein